MDPHRYNNRGDCHRIWLVGRSYARQVGDWSRLVYRWLSVKSRDALYFSDTEKKIVMTYQLAGAYFIAAFPGLARNTLTLREHAEKYNSGKITREEYDTVDSMKRNEIVNMGLYVCGVGQLPLVAIGIGILYGLHSNASTANNNWALSVIVAWTSTYWLILAIPWFFLEKRRPGQPLPPGKNYLTAGLWQIYRAAIQIWRLKQSLAYLIGIFFSFHQC